MKLPWMSREAHRQEVQNLNKLIEEITDELVTARDTAKTLVANYMKLSTEFVTERAEHNEIWFYTQRSAKRLLDESAAREHLDTGEVVEFLNWINRLNEEFSNLFYSDFHAAARAKWGDGDVEKLTEEQRGIYDQLEEG